MKKISREKPLRGESSQYFFFQAEDGIRDYYASRGLGDVYKRQAQIGDHETDGADDIIIRETDALEVDGDLWMN